MPMTNTIASTVQVRNKSGYDLDTIMGRVMEEIFRIFEI